MSKRPLNAAEKARLAELVAARTPFWKICEEIGRDRWTTWRNIEYLRRVPPSAAEAIAVAAVAR